MVSETVAEIEGSQLMAATKHSHRREDFYLSSSLFDMEDVWRVFSDIALNLVLFLIFTIIAQYLEFSQVFDALARSQQQQSLWKAMQEDPYFEELIQNKSLTMVIQGSLQRFRFAADVVFNTGEATLLPRGRDVLSQFRRFLGEKTLPDLNVEVEGHTDRIPVTSRRYKDNWELSTQRALTVVRLFQELSANSSTEVGLKPSRISAIGYGEYRPLEDKDDSFLNRRVEIRLDYSNVSSKTIIQSLPDNWR